MTRMAAMREDRYKVSSQRNVHNLVNRFRGVNTGTAKTRESYVARLSNLPSITLQVLKQFAGVRNNDTSFDAELGRILEEMNNLTKKAEKAEKAEKVEKAEKTEKHKKTPVATAEAPPSTSSAASPDAAPLKFVLPKATKPTNKHDKKGKDRKIH